MFPKIVLLFFITFHLFSNEIIKFQNKSEVLSIGKLVEYFEDTDKKLSLTQIFTSKQFKTFSKEIYFNPKPKGSYWFKFDIQNQTDEDLILELSYIFLNKLIVIDSNSKLELLNYNKNKNEIEKESIFFRIPILEKNELNSKTIFILIETEFPLDIGFFIGTNLKINQKEIEYYSIHYFFMGIISILILFNLFVYFTVKEKLYLYYIGVLFFSATTRLFINGFNFFEIIGLESFQNINWYILNWNSFVYIFLTPFLISYLNLENSKSKIRVVLFVLTILLSLVFPIINVMSMEKLQISFLFQRVIFIYFLFCLVLLIKSWFDGNKNVKFVTLGWLCFFISIIIFVLLLNGVLPFNFFTRNAPLFGIALEGLFFSFALGNRINVLTFEKNILIEKEILTLKEKEQLVFENKILLQEQNRVLELKVAERTLELENKNEELEDLNEELNSQAKSLIESKTKLEKANNFKSIFLATMSHEIRTPINGILGISGILQEKELGMETKDFINSINYSAKNLLLLVNDILDISKIEAGKLEIEKISFDLTELIIELEKNFIFSNVNKNIRFDIEKPNFPFNLIGDQNRIRQVLTNFMSNATKFTESGTIQLKLTEKMNKPNEINILFEVIDKGIGISEENQKYLFKEYSQAESSTSRNYGGTGLGLSICKKLIELMEGKIGVKSELSKGSTFWFLLNFEIEAKHKIISNTYETNSKILVAEDNVINQKIAVTFFKKLGFKIDIAYDGEQVLEKLDNENYDIIFMDCHMPNLDGYETTKILREKNFNKPIIALTADNSNSERVKCLSVGMNDFLSKPFTEPEIKSILNKYLKLNTIV